VKRLLLILALATGAAAQESTDLAATLDIVTLPSPPRPGDTIAWRVTVKNNGPSVATNVFVLTELNGVSTCHARSIGTLAVNESRTIDCSAALPREQFAYVYVETTLAEDDPDQSNNRVDRLLELATPPDLTVDVEAPNVVDAALPFTAFVRYANIAAPPANDVVVTIDVRGATEVRKVPDFCTSVGTTVTCRHATLERQLPRGVELEIVAPDASARPVTIAASIDAREDDLKPESNTTTKETRTYRTFFVTNTNDTGGGSLREAIHGANAQCRDDWPCKIAFRIPAAGAQWLTIEPSAALPLISVPLTIDGAMQTAYAGDTNPRGPEIEISGAKLDSGHAIESACPASIRGLTINGFPGSAIQLSAAPACLGGTAFGFNTTFIEDNHLGTDPTGSTAIANERGLVIERGGPTVRRNVISGNTRSGIFVDGGQVLIVNNIIGLDRALTRDLGNGASGIYLGPRSNGTDVADNFIGFNHHFGVSLDPRSTYSALRGNSFQANWGLAIDFGLDGPTIEVPDASASAPVRRPIIRRARYDAVTNTTTIEGTSETSPERHEVHVSIYANDEPDPSGFGEGQYYLGQAVADRNDGFFTFTVAGRTPGKWISATSTRQNIIGFARQPGSEGICGCGFTTQTSEFSRTVQVPD
jgi:Right handed beta helix region/Domain of unknown function DUF11